MKPATPQGPFFTWSLQDGMRAFVTEEQQRVHWQTIKHDPRARYWKVEVERPRETS